MRLLLLLLCLPLASALEFSEVLYDPPGTDNTREFVELIGDEDLTGCTVADAHSTDTLEHTQKGNNVILIVEEDSPYVTDATVYSAGKAIGNGLSNTADTITVSCNGTVLVEMSYDAADFEPGRSIVFSGAWTLGPVNGTPGIVEGTEEPADETIPDDPMNETPCDTTLALTVSETEGLSGDPLTFTVVSDGYAAWEAEANGTVFSYGDTLTRRTFGFSLPEGNVTLTATARQCDARQRAVRKITILPVPEVMKNATNTTVVRQEHAAPEPEPPAPHAEKLPEAPIVTAHVVYDRNTNIIPWVSSFGIVTLLVSSILFFRLKQEGLG